MQSNSLRELIDRFVFYKRHNGYMYQTGAYYLEKYAQWILEWNPETVIPSKKSVEGFLERNKDTPGSLYNAASVLRKFSRYLIIRGYPDTYLIPAGRIRLPTPVQPYFFTDNEISAFFRKCDKVTEDPHHKGRYLVLPAMFRLLYCCGLRCKEIRVLARKDVHLDRRYLDILQSKGPKSRRVYISGELADYLTRYDNRIGVLFPERKIFFPNKDDYPYVSDKIERFVWAIQ